MTKANQTPMHSTRWALLLCATAGVLPALPASAQIGFPENTAAPAAPVGPAEAQAPTPMLSPARPERPGMIQPYATPDAQRQAPPLAEPEGPVTSWDPLRFAIALDGRTTWLRDAAAKRLVGDRTSSAGGLCLQADVLRPSAALALRVDLSWMRASSAVIQSDTGLQEKLDTELLSLGVSLRYHVWKWLAPYARFAGGVGRDKLAIADLSDRHKFAQGSAGAGIFVRSPGLRLWQGPAAPAIGLVGHLEGGYAMASSSDLSLHASIPSAGDTPIPTNSVAIGSVGRSAPYLRASLGLAF